MSLKPRDALPSKGDNLTIHSFQMFEIVFFKSINLMLLSTEYWDFYPCAVKFLNFMGPKLCDLKKPNKEISEALLKAPIPSDEFKKNKRFPLMFLQFYKGYKGWRFILTTSGKEMRASMAMIVDEIILHWCPELDQ